jgi:hypothetical protein
MLWIVNKGGKADYIEHNGDDNHFGRKHFLLPLTNAENVNVFIFIHQMVR